MSGSGASIPRQIRRCEACGNKVTNHLRGCAKAPVEESPAAPPERAPLPIRRTFEKAGHALQQGYSSISIDRDRDLAAHSLVEARALINSLLFELGVE